MFSSLSARPPAAYLKKRPRLPNWASLPAADLFLSSLGLQFTHRKRSRPSYLLLLFVEAFFRGEPPPVPIRRHLLCPREKLLGVFLSFFCVWPRTVLHPRRAPAGRCRWSSRGLSPLVIVRFLPLSSGRFAPVPSSRLFVFSSVSNCLDLFAEPRSSRVESPCPVNV